MGILWIIIVGFIAGLIARFLSPGPNKPVGFLLTTALGIAGAFVATFVGQAVGWYRVDQGAGIIAATLGAFAVLFVWNRLVVNNTISDPGIDVSHSVVPQNQTRRRPTSHRTSRDLRLLPNRRGQKVWVHRLREEPRIYRQVGRSEPARDDDDPNMGPTSRPPIPRSSEQRRRNHCDIFRGRRLARYEKHRRRYCLRSFAMNYCDRERNRILNELDLVSPRR